MDGVLSPGVDEFVDFGKPLLTLVGVIHGQFQGITGPGSVIGIGQETLNTFDFLLIPAKTRYGDLETKEIGEETGQASKPSDHEDDDLPLQGCSRSSLTFFTRSPAYRQTAAYSSTGISIFLEGFFR